MVSRTICPQFPFSGAGVALCSASAQIGERAAQLESNTAHRKSRIPEILFPKLNRGYSAGFVRLLGISKSPGL
jgi:hypothetical protein